MSRRTLLLAAGFLLAALVFTLFPGIDLWTNGLFYRADGGFFLANAAPIRLLYRAVPFLTWLVLLFALLASIRFWLGDERCLGCNRRTVLYLVVALALGPGLITNTILKDHWGRARPSQTTEFGGTKSFTPALVPSNQCERNCSFVAGHPALGFYLVSVAFLLPPAWRRRGEALALTAGALFGLARIAQGGHFLSDVVFSGLIVTATSYGLWWLMIVRGLPPSRFAQPLGTALASPSGHWFLRWSAITAAAIAVSVALFDRPLARFCHEQSDALHRVFRFITQFGLSGWYLIPAAILFVALLIAARLEAFAAVSRRLGAYAYLPLYVFLMLATPGLVADLVKIVIGRARPKLLFADDRFGVIGIAFRSDFWSFPSGHTVNAVALAIAVTAIWPRLRPAAILFATLVALSRIVITQHYLSDVIGGAFIAVMVTRYVELVLARSGIVVAELRAGNPPRWPATPWRQRFRLGPAPAAPITGSP